MDDWQRRAEAEADEALAALDGLRNRGLGDAARGLLHRGDVVAATFARQSFLGVPVAAGRDLLTLRTATGDVDVWLGAALALRVVEQRRTGGLPHGAGAQTFTARLFEHEAGSRDVELGCPPLDSVLTGRLTAVALDHVVLDDRDGQRWFVARAALGWARSVT